MQLRDGISVAYYGDGAIRFYFKPEALEAHPVTGELTVIISETERKLIEDFVWESGWDGED